jgi:hypothetical protein
MNIRPALIAYPEALVQPAQAAFHHPAVHSQATTVRLAAPSQHWQDAAPSHLLTQGVGIIAPVSLDLERAAPGSATFTSHWRNGLYQGQGLGYVMDIGPSELYCQGDALSVGDNVMFAPCLGPIRRVGPRLLPPKTARTEALSSTARRQSIRWAAGRRSKEARWICSHRPACWKSRSLRQQVMPLPQPIS